MSKARELLESLNNSRINEDKSVTFGGGFPGNHIYKMTFDGKHMKIFLIKSPSKPILVLEPGDLYNMYHGAQHILGINFNNY